MDQEIELTARWVAGEGDAARATSAFVRHRYRQPSAWVLPGVLVVIALVPSFTTPDVPLSHWLLSLGFGVAVAGLATLLRMAGDRRRVRRMIDLDFFPGAVTEVGLSSSALRVRDPSSDTTFHFTQVSRVDVRDDQVFVHLVPASSFLCLPRVLLPDADVEAIRSRRGPDRATDESGDPADRDETAPCDDRIPLQHRYVAGPDDVRRLALAVTWHGARTPGSYASTLAMAIIWGYLAHLVAPSYGPVTVVLAGVVLAALLTGVTFLASWRSAARACTPRYAEGLVSESGFDDHAMRLRSATGEWVLPYAEIAQVSVRGDCVFVRVRAAKGRWYVFPGALIDDDDAARVRAGG